MAGIVKCDNVTCKHNRLSECENDYIALENGYCQEYEEDESKCIYCGAKLESYYEGRPYGLTIAKENMVRCPNCG